MGVRGGICAFDEKRLREVVIPALRSGTDHPIVERAAQRLWSYGLGLEGYKYQRYYEDPSGTPPCGFEALPTIMAHVDDSFRRCDLGRDFWVVEGFSSVTVEPCDEHGWGYSELVELVEWVLTRETILAYQLLGWRGDDPWMAFELPYQLYETTTDPRRRRLQQLLKRLDDGHAFWMHDGFGYGEGICGWLDATETRELATLLPPPRQPDNEPDPAHTEYHLEVQQRFRSVLNWALDHGAGLLWGRDLRIFYETEDRQSAGTIFARTETPPVRL
ncbi:hypothetical protein AB0M34_01740 [Nocardia sp. NPDC050193]